MADFSRETHCEEKGLATVELMACKVPLCFLYLAEKTDYIWRKVVNDCWKEKGEKSILTVSKEENKSEKQMFILGS